jgi:cold shock CspA family protein
VTSTGRVVAFDENRGHGAVIDADDREWLFHAVEIIDGSRRIAVGTPVSFELVPGLLGRWEAASVRPLSGTRPDQDSSEDVSSSS